MRKDIRFGVMSESLVLKKWEAECIKQALEIDNVKLSLFIHPALNKEPDKRNHIKLRLHHGSQSNLLFSLYEKFFFKPNFNSPFDLSEKFKDIPALYCETYEEDSFEFFTEEDIKKIKSKGLDFIILFSGFKNITGEILKTTEFGIWTYYFGDKNHHENPPGFWNIYDHSHATGVFLHKLNSNNDEAMIIKEGYFKTILHSHSLNLNNLLFEACYFVKNICTEINLTQKKAFKDCIKTKRVKNFDYYQNPNNIEFLRFLLKLFKNKIKKILNNLFFAEQWHIGYINSSINNYLEKNDALKLNIIPTSSKNTFSADPFVIEHNDSLFVFFENFEYKSNKAKISCLPLNIINGKIDVKTVLEKSRHLSYPFIFKYNGDIYMIPGDWESNKISIYKSKDFPLDWEKTAVLLEDIQAVDPTLVEYEDLFWLFCTKKNNGPDLNLYIYYSKNLFGSWKAHKKNPVKCDICSARSAGNIFKYKGNLIRPSQNSSKTYGGSIVLNKITKLNPSEFHEEPIKFIKPNNYGRFYKGVHTLSESNNVILLDVKRNSLSLHGIKKVMHKKISSIFPKIGVKYRFISVPKFFERHAYFNAIDKCVELLKTQKNIISIYQIGNINHPGISDIDLVVVFDKYAVNNFNAASYFKDNDKYLFTHSIGGVCAHHLADINKYSLFHNISHLWGKRFFSMEKKLGKFETELLNIQTALEYLISNYIDITIQLKYKVFKLRMLLQHIKALKYDLELLKISTGNLHEMVTQLIIWMDDWFGNPIGFKEFCEWIDIFYNELYITLKQQLQENLFYIPGWVDNKLGRNVKIKFGDSLSYNSKGFPLPKSISAISKKTFNLNNRFNSFIFTIPYSTKTDNNILEHRFELFKELKYSTNKHYPNFSPLISGFANRLL